MLNPPNPPGHLPPPNPPTTRRWWTRRRWQKAGLFTGWAVLAAGSAAHTAAGVLDGLGPAWSTLIGGMVVASAFYLRRREHRRDHEIFQLGIVAGIRLRKHGVTQDDVVVDLPVMRRSG